MFDELYLPIKIKENTMTPQERNHIKAFQQKGRLFEGRPGKGVPIKKFQPYCDVVLNKLVRKGEMENPEALLPSDGRPVVAIVSHGPGAAWIPLVALVGKFFIDNGYGDIIGGMAPHKAMFLIPGFKTYYRETLGAPTDIHTVEAIVGLLNNRDIGLTGTAPEGANCLLSFEDYVAPFRSCGMIAAAIKANAAICLMAHQGAERWSLRLNLPFGLRAPGPGGLRGIVIPLPPIRKIDYYRVCCKRYEPSISWQEMEGMSKADIRRHLSLEIEAIRKQLNDMTRELRVNMQALSTQKAEAKKYAATRRREADKNRIWNSIFPDDDRYMGLATSPAR